MIPSGKCQCGCGANTKVSPSTVPRWGYVKGEPRRFIQGHHIRLEEYQKKPLPNPISKPILCSCGCGQTVKPTKHDRTAWRTGKIPTRRFVKGHDKRKSPIDYCLEDRGYKTLCWIWQRAKTSAGYGAINVNGQQKSAHRVYYENAYGPISTELEIDHLCYQQDCVCPEHLEPVSSAENMRRRRPFWASNGRATWLSRGKQSR